MSQADTVVVALVGNPNTGKSTLFNALSGMRQRVGNYPGVTVEMKKGRTTVNGVSLEFIDLPGTYSLAARSPDEMIAVDLLLGMCPGEPRPDVVLSIVDAANLERHLYLTTQLLELGIPVVVALNMIDVAEAQGIDIDVEKLRERLGVPIVPIQANRGRGLDRLKKELVNAVGRGASASRPDFPEPFEREVRQLVQVDSHLPDFLARRVLLDVNGSAQNRFLNGSVRTERLRVLTEARQRLETAGCAVPLVEARVRFAWLRRQLAGCIRRPGARSRTWTDRIDRYLTHRVWGTMAFLAVMFLLFQAIYSWAGPVMDGVDAAVAALGGLLGDQLPQGILKNLVVDGIVAGVGSVLVFLPQIMILFAFIAILEDCGYMARAAFLMDRLMAQCGLSGKSFIPMLSSLACAVPGVMATRVIENRRDRLATILVAPLMSCSARLPVYLLLIGAFVRPGRPSWVAGATMFTMYLIGFVTAPLVALVLKRTLLRGETPVFVMEMPNYRWPSVRTVMRRVLDAGWSFIYRAGTVILATMILVWALLYFPRGDGSGQRYDLRVAALSSQIEELRKANDSAGTELPDELRNTIEALEEERASIEGEWRRQSWLGQAGRWIEPAVRPLGWDWRIGMAVLASFPAREVVVGTLGIVYNVGPVDVEILKQAEDAGTTRLGQALREAVWDDDPTRAVFTLPTALSLMVFFALCCQCGSTLAAIRRETRSWTWPAFTFAYMTVLAYTAAFVTYQVGTYISQIS